METVVQCSGRLALDPAVKSSGGSFRSCSALAGEGHECTASTQQCLDKMATKLKTTGWVGIEMEVDEATKKYRISKVIPGSPAEASGMKPGDILFAMYGIALSEENEKQIGKARKDWQPGQDVTYTVHRDGRNRDISLTLAPMPADVLANWIGRHMMEHVKVAHVATDAKD